MGTEGQLLQEVYRSDPWKLLCSCIMLNQTTRRQVDGVRDKLFERYDAPWMMAHANSAHIADAIRPLGLQNRRALTLVKFSKWWYDFGGLAIDDRVLDLHPPGVGEYAADSYRIFVVGPTPENVAYAMDRPEWPADKELKKWFGSVREVGDSFLARAWGYEDQWAYQLQHPGGWTA